LIQHFKAGLLLFLLLCGIGVQAEETKDRFVRLTLNQRTGNFSLFYLNNPAESIYAPILGVNPAASYLSVNVNGIVHRLDRSAVFKTSIKRVDNNPTVFYESPFLLVSVAYVPVRTANSRTANGIRINITAENKGEEEATVGLRALIDTHLGEGKGLVPFVTDNLEIEKETLLERPFEETFWISRGADVSLMGNIVNPVNRVNPLNDVSKEPDLLHFANWKRLNDVPWKANLHKNRSFNRAPYSFGDSAVAYFWEPEALGAGASFSYTIFLTTEDTAWFTPPVVAEKPAAPPPVEALPPIPAPSALQAVSPAPQQEADDSELVTLRRLQGTLDQFISGEVNFDERDLSEIETTLDNLPRRR